MYECINAQNLLSTQRIYTNIMGIFLISNCLFHRLNNYVGNGGTTHTSSTDNNINHGGILYIYNMYSELFINECTFAFCFSVYGGAIYYHSEIDNSQTFINKTCGFSCGSQNNYGHLFAAIIIKQNNNYHIDFKMVSLIKCAPYPYSGYHSMFLGNGNQNIINLNSTNNNVIENSGFRSNNPYNLLIQYSSFVNNNSSNMCVSIYNCFNFSNIKNNNFLLNNSPSNGIISILDNGILNIEENIFSENYNLLFYFNSLCLIILNNNKINNNLNFLFNLNINKINNNIITNFNFQTLKINYYSTYLCYTNNKIISSIINYVKIKFFFLLNIFLYI